MKHYEKVSWDENALGDEAHNWTSNNEELEDENNDCGDFDADEWWRAQAENERVENESDYNYMRQMLIASGRWDRDD